MFSSDVMRFVQFSVSKIQKIVKQLWTETIMARTGILSALVDAQVLSVAAIIIKQHPLGTSSLINRFCYLLSHIIHSPPYPIGVG